VGFVDDDPLKAGRLIHGLPVYGSSDQIADIIEGGKASVVVVTSTRVMQERILAVAGRIGHARVRRLRLLLEEVLPLPSLPDPRA
jgi:FlaA1/EpsC-like NDP-sugar epimerase